MKAAALLGAILAIAPAGPAQGKPPGAAPANARLMTLDLLDARRGRAVPILLYGAGGRPRPLALISHGYGGTNRAYSFLAEALVARGYIVASIQHELTGDPEMPTAGEPAVVRRPWWEQGADTLEFAIRQLRALRFARRGRVLLVGHSNGGDTSMLFAARRPDWVAAVFSLDSRRMPFPRTARPRICSVRSSDQVADPGVLPSPEEQARLGMVIGTVPGLIHNDMWDAATPERKAAVVALLDRCLQSL